MLAEHDSWVSRYVSMAKNRPALDREEELRLARRWKNEGDRAARDVLARTLVQTVVAIAFKYRRYGTELSELIAEGNVGLLHAISKFDPERGNRLVTYAAHWIRAYVLECVLRSWSVVGGGSGALRTKVFFKLRRERARIANLVGDAEEAERLLAERMETSPERVRRMLQQVELRDMSLDASPQGDTTTRFIDAIASDERNQEELAVSAETTRDAREKVEHALGMLDARERFIVEKHLMADREEELSLAEVGRLLGVSRERARQLEARARRKLRLHVKRLETARAPQPRSFGLGPRTGARAA
jgi:RNA polymerase sigma-32 factor